MKFLIILSLAVAAFAFPESQLVLRNRVMPVQDGIEGRITGGEKASIGQFPYQAGLAIKLNILSSFWCGGSVLNSIWILTAAHCVEGKPTITAYMGATVRMSAEVTRKATKFIIHPKWNPNTVQNDIAMVKVDAFSFSSNIQPVKLPALANSYPSYVGESAIISGWGLDSDKANGVTRDLLFALVKIANNKDCANIFGKTSVTTSNMCILTPQGKSTCSGDSGGPLVLSSNKVQVGLTSYGAAAGCEKKYPAVFTRIDSFLEWIQDIISTN